ncbi:transcriptional regulator, LacI family [Nakamurella panacisegetis]|uniref:Transcriptional regulator, LacI family n=1 Tax=Nakamurella panacisegetis TaxID=1090615 RepID=A0A1H0IPU8_9ACTN|nr:LacI family DNA-binding transcriptional regulator [Nakamurella panacisegetis]SDO33340.1 transcriptional regulator, LacI family [Nakamurella panacisegetis]
MTGDRPSVERRATIADVAAVAGVSPALVSIVIRGVPGASAATRQRVLAVAEGLGYRPDQRARMLRRQRSRLLGVSFEVQQAFHGDLVEGIYTAAQEAGYEVVLSAVAPSRSEERAAQTLLDDRCEAMILLGPRVPVATLGRWASRMPLVVVGRSVRHPGVDTVRSADDKGMSLAVGHLVAAGHSRIAHVDGASAPGSAERRRSFAGAMGRHALADQARVVPGGPTEEYGAAATRTLLAQGIAPTAVVAYNDRCALGVLDTLHRNGRQVPQDVSVIGWDDSRLAALSYVDLTTVGQNPGRLARLAVARIAGRLDGTRIGPREQVIPPELVLRSSTGPPPRT